MRRLINWFKAKIREKLHNLRIWTNKSRIFLAVICLIIGFTGCFIKEHYQDFGIINQIKIVVESQLSPVKVNVAMAKADVIDQTQDLNKGTEQTKALSEPSIKNNELLIKKYFGDEWKVAYAIMMAESRGEATRIGDTHLGRPSVGLFQISQIYHNYSTEQLQDPEFNVKTAKEIRDNGGFERWTTYRNNQYLSFL